LVKIGAGGGLTQVLAPEIFIKNISDEGYGFSTEWNTGVIGKVDLPLIPFTPRAFILYHNLAGSEEFETTGEEQSSIVEYRQTIFEFGVGAQYNFIPAPLGFDPYLALDISFNSFGDFSKTNDISEEKTDGFNRFGGGIGVGTEISIIPVVNLDLYLSYKMFNLTGKKDGEETVSAVTLDAFIIFNFL
jgi:hypothetical protein